VTSQSTLSRRRRVHVQAAAQLISRAAPHGAILRRTLYTPAEPAGSGEAPLSGERPPAAASTHAYLTNHTRAWFTGSQHTHSEWETGAAPLPCTQCHGPAALYTVPRPRCYSVPALLAVSAGCAYDVTACDVTSVLTAARVVGITSSSLSLSHSVSLSRSLSGSI